MGQSSSSEGGRRRRSNSSYPQPQPQPYSYPVPPPSIHPYAPNPNPLYSYNHHPNPNPNYNHPNSYSNQLSQGYNSLLRFLDSLIGRTNQQPYYDPNQGNGWWVPPPPRTVVATSASYASSSVLPQYVEHQKAKTVKNDVNVHKDTIRIEVDEHNPDHYLVSFNFDAVVDGSITIYYFAREGANGEFSPVYHMHTPNKFPFQKGFGQKFCQPSGSGIDLGFFELDDLAKPLNGEAFPLVIHAAAGPQESPSTEEHAASTCAQATQAVIQKAHDGSFQAKAIKQILWTNGERYELQEIFGLVNSAEAAEAELKDDNDDDIGKECVICLTETRNTTVLPCRHMCLCSECAKALRVQSNKCPICRQPIEKLLEINVNGGTE